MSIRRCKKHTNLVNDAHMKSCIARYDSGAYTRVQFLRAASHSVGAHAVPVAATDASDTDDDDDQDVNGSNQLQSGALHGNSSPLQCFEPLSIVRPN